VNRRSLTALGVLLVVAAVVSLGAVLGFGRSGASAAGPGRYGYRMMAGYGNGNGGYGPGMMGGHGSGYGPGMMGNYGARSSGPGSATATLVIRHQYAHCHAWSLNGGPFKAHQAMTLERGASLTVSDFDVMPHRFVELAGASVTMRNGTTMPMMGGSVSQAPGVMSRMGAWTTVTFSQAGVYRFRTRAGEDYMQGIRTSGTDNVLSLTVTVH
jgi:hypothetical protein